MNSEKRPLWAPWRIDFIRSPKDKNCFLCGKNKELANDPDAELLIHQSSNVFVILNRFPYNSGHLMVAPYRHIADISDLTEAERIDLMNTLISAKKTLSELLQPDGFNVGFNLGLAAGAGVEDHIHMHVVPRWVGDTNFMPVLSDTRVVPEALLKTAELLRENWS